MEKHTKYLETLTASEALDEHKCLAAFLKWDKRMIGVFCQGGLLVGKYDKTLKEWIVRRDSLNGLLAYVKATYNNAFGD